MRRAWVAVALTVGLVTVVGVHGCGVNVCPAGNCGNTTGAGTGGGGDPCATIEALMAFDCPGDPGSAKAWCMQEIGQTKADCTMALQSAFTCIAALPKSVFFCSGEGTTAFDYTPCLKEFDLYHECAGRGVGQPSGDAGVCNECATRLCDAQSAPCFGDMDCNPCIFNPTASGCATNAKFQTLAMCIQSMCSSACQ